MYLVGFNIPAGTYTVTSNTEYEAYLIHNKTPKVESDE